MAVQGGCDTAAQGSQMATIPKPALGTHRAEMRRNGTSRAWTFQRKLDARAWAFGQKPAIVVASPAGVIGVPPTMRQTPVEGTPR